MYRVLVMGKADHVNQIVEIIITFVFIKKVLNSNDFFIAKMNEHWY